MTPLAQLTANAPLLTAMHSHVEGGFFTALEEALITKLLADGQQHLFAEWDEPGVHDDLKRTFLSTIQQIDASYPTGILGYTHNARRLLAEARDGVNVFDGFTPSKPDCVDLSQFDDNLVRYEALGAKHVGELAIVMVAGGLGERLGYSGIKIDIAVESVTNMSYLAYYAACIKAMETGSATGRRIPFVIMTSDQTHEKTLASLNEKNYFGLSPDQVHIVTQKLVPALADNDAQLALEKKYQLVLKPHGHGDIHMLMHTSGLARRFLAEGISHLLFIQDTNGQVFNIAMAALGSSVQHGFDFNSVAVKRFAGEAAGAITKLTKAKESFTLNVEYNLLDPLLRATTCTAGDIPASDGYSPFPGNINVLVIKLKSYLHVLEATKGIIAEFVNPKYADPARRVFKTPTRLETMMQDLPRLYHEAEKVGVTIFDRVYCFSANKNNLADARKKFESKGPAESAITAESDFYHGFRVKLAHAGAQLAKVSPRQIQGIPFVGSPRVYLSPSFALTLGEVGTKIRGLTLEEETTLYLDGHDITLQNVVLKKGASLIVRAAEGTHVVVNDVTLTTEGHEIVPLNETMMHDPALDENIRMRGFRIIPLTPLVYDLTRPGSYIIDQNGLREVGNR